MISCGPRGLPGSLLSADEIAIVRSVLYASLFEYPLTLAQLRHTLIGSTQTPSQILATYDRSDVLQAIVDHRDGLFFPRGQEALVEERARREARSLAFLQDNRRTLAAICAIPYVRMVALSGSIAHLNLDRDGDLDLFIVTRGRRAWSVTVAVVVLARLLKRRRIVCANYVVADTSLAFEPQDLFAASQIIHLKPIVGRDVYRRLLAQNRFVSRFYPNFHDAGPGGLALRRNQAVEAARRAFETLFMALSALVEVLCRSAYRWHLLRRSASWRSPEQVRLEPDCLKLHTQSHRQSVLDRYDRAVDEALRDVAHVRVCSTHVANL